MGRIPLSLIAGWQGSGKSKLLERTIRGDLAGPCAAVVPTASKFREAGFVVKADEEVVEQVAGCSTCAVRYDLIRCIGHLVRRKVRPKRIMVELAARADTAIAAQTILGDPTLAHAVELDGVITVVNASSLFVRASSGMPIWPDRGAGEQVLLADRIVLNRLDLLTPKARDRVMELIRDSNRLAEVLEDDGRSLDPSRILGLCAYRDAAAQAVACLHGKTGPVSQAVASGHLLEVAGDLNPERFDKWLMSLDHNMDRRLLRVVGVVAMSGEEKQVLCHRVGTFLNLRRANAWQGERLTRLFAGGRLVTPEFLQSGLKECIDD